MLRAVLVLLLAGALGAQTPIKLVNDATPSPDGKRIAFSWRGDIWTASILGGDVTRLTSHPGDDSWPAWSPDGRQLAFVSSRSGSRQINVIDAWGGATRQVTLNTDGYGLLDWTPDGKGLLVRANRDHWWRSAGRFYLQSTDGTQAPELLFNGYGANGRLSPDGRRLLFTREGTGAWRKRYRGAQESQVWLFERASGAFTQLQGNEGGSRWPMWGPNGDSYYYCCPEGGAWNIIRCGVVTDERTQLTKFSGDGVMFPRISRDGSIIVFRRIFDLWRLDIATERLTRIDLTYSGDPTVETVRRTQTTRATGAAFTGDGRETAFTAGGDLWVMDTELKEPVRITATPEEESSPVFSSDYKTLYFISDAGGRTDIWSAKPKDEKLPFWRNTGFTLAKLTDDEGVESGLRLWDDGKRIAFHDGFDVRSMELATKKERTLITSWNQPDYDLSPDGKWITYSVQDDDYNHDVWIKPLDESRPPFNLSVHPDNDRSPRWSADGSMIAFTGRRWGRETDIVHVTLEKEKDEETDRQRRLEKALKKMKGRGKKTSDTPKKTDEPSTAPKAAADPVTGNWRGNATGPPPIPASGIPMQLQVKLGPGGAVTGAFVTPLGTGTITSGTFDKSTGKVSLVIDADGEEVKIEGMFENGSASGTWSGPMGKGTWSAKREGGGDSNASIGKPKKKEKVNVVIDFEGLRDRLKRISVANSTERNLRWSASGRKLYFSGTGGTFSVEFPNQTSPSKLTGSLPSNGAWLEDGRTIGGLSGGRPATVSSSGKATTYPFTVRQEVDLKAHHAAVFDEAWRIMRDRFYDERLGNRDWNAIRTTYGEMAAQCVSANEMSQVVTMMLGELNGSHLGFRANPTPTSPRAGAHQWTPVTGHLGARFDPAHDGPGLRVSDVVKGTPASRDDSRLHPGDVILKIDGHVVDPSMEIATVLTGRRDREVRLDVKGTDGKPRQVTIRPTTSSTVRGLLYEKWIEDTRALVHRLSGGKLGYVHIRGMGQNNLVRFDAELYRIGHGKDGLVIDVRENGGGSITDHLLTCLCQPAHAITRSRGGAEGYPHDRRIYASWQKPIVVLCNQNSFSNAEIFSHAVKTLKRGQVVGVPTAGGVISTGGSTVMNAGFIRLPTRGWYTLNDGEDMELHGAEPHHILWPRPGELPAGRDRQVEKAVEVLLDDVRQWKAQPRPKLRKATERK